MSKAVTTYNFNLFCVKKTVLMFWKIFFLQIKTEKFTGNLNIYVKNFSIYLTEFENIKGKYLTKWQLRSETATA